MIARHSKPIARKARSQAENEKRKHHSDVRRLKQWCEDHQITCYTFNDAPIDSICVLSMDDYSLTARRASLDQDNESYFIDEKDYEEYTNEGFL